MQRKRLNNSNCSIARALDEVGEWWTLLIVRECTEGSTRFDEFQRELGISRNILTARLERLVRLGIFERFLLSERAATFGYRLTRKGADLFPVLMSLKEWGDKWLSECGQPKIELVEHATGVPVDPVGLRGSNGQSLNLRDVRFVAGPAATISTQQNISRRNTRIIGDACIAVAASKADDESTAESVQASGDRSQVAT